MLIPLTDNLKWSSFPYITIIFILLNVVIWGAGLIPREVQIDSETKKISSHDIWVAEYGAVPCEILRRCENQSGQVVVKSSLINRSAELAEIQVPEKPRYISIISSAFLHGGLIHLTINMLFLLTFGKRIEMTIGHLRFAIFYLMSGIVSVLAQSLASPDGSLPIVGASGAIAAAIGAYIVLYPRARILTFVIVPIVFWLPAWVVAGGWAILQLITSWQQVLAPVALDGGVAHLSHLGGFIFGALVIGSFTLRKDYS